MDQKKFLSNFPNSVIQFFDDNKSCHNGTMAKITSEYNERYIQTKQDAGCGVFFSVNGFKPGTRKLETLTNINGLFIDGDVCKEEDGKSKDEINELKKPKLLSLTSYAPLTPHFIIETKNGFQAIWFVHDLKLKEEFDVLENGLINYFQADTGAKDIAHVLRLPNTFHLKDPANPFLCKLIVDNSSLTPYSKNDIIKNFNLIIEQDQSIDFVQKNRQLDGMDPVYNPSIEIKKALTIPLTEVIKFTAGEAGIKVEFKKNSNGSHQIIENGEATSGFISSRGEFCFSPSGKQRKGNQITVSEFYLNEKGKKNLNRQKIAEMLIKKFSLKESLDNNPKKTRFITLQELCARNFPKPEYIIRQLLPTKSLNLMIGDPGSSKSWIAFHYIDCILNGKKVFDEFETIRKNILLINIDDTLQEIADRLINHIQIPNKTTGLFILDSDDDFHDNFHICDEKGNASENFEFLKQFVIEKNIGLIIVDTFSLIHSLDENTSQEIMKVIVLLKQIVRSGNTAILLIHHQRKNIEDRNTQNALRGSSAIAASVNTLLQVQVTREKHLKITQHKNKISRKLENPLEVVPTENPLSFVIIEPIKKMPEDVIKDEIIKYFDKNHKPDLAKNNLVETLLKSLPHSSKSVIERAINKLEGEAYILPDPDQKKFNSKVYKFNEEYILPIDTSADNQQSSILPVLSNGGTDSLGLNTHSSDTKCIDNQ